MKMDELNYDHYSMLIGEDLLITDFDPPKTVRIEEVSELVENDKFVNFSILFRSTVDDFLEQGTYKMTHSEFGEGMIFLVPVGKDERGYLYESVFSRESGKSEGDRASRKHTSSSDG